MKAEFSRRSFLKAAAVGAAACASSSVFAPAAALAEEEEKEISDLIVKNIVIVGAGAAGMLAAYGAGKAGAADVLVVANCPNANATNGSLVSGTCAVDTPQTREAGQEFSLDDLYARMIDFAHWTVNARLVKNCVNMLAEDIAIFEEMGVPTTLAGDRYSIGFEEVHLFNNTGKGQIFEDYISSNFGVEFMYDMELDELIMADGKCVGLYMTNENGETVEILANAVIMACGGYMGNEDMLHEVYGNIDIVNLGLTYQDGKGIKAVEAAGGFRESTHGMGMSDINGASYKMRDKNVYSENFNSLTASAFYGNLLVDEHGDRFMNEYMAANASMSGGGEATLHVGKYYAIYPQEVIDAMREEGYYSYLGSPAYWISGMLLYGAAMPKIDDYIAEAVEDGWCYVGDTVAEVAEMAGLENLEATVAEYDAMVEAGEDTMFHKTTDMMKKIDIGGPYYLIEFNPGAFNTFGGCRTDAYCRALTSDFTVIPGLYIAGVENGSLYSRPYYDVGGTCSGLAYASGRLAGMTAAADWGMVAADAAEEEAAAAGGYKDGTYTATTVGASPAGSGNVDVTVTIEGGQITAVDIVAPKDAASLGATAIKKLPDKIIAAQGIDGVNVVSGCSLTSQAILDAVAECLAQAM